MKQERNRCVFRPIKQGILPIAVLFIVLFFWMNFTVSISSGAPASTGDMWKIVFGPSMDSPHNYSSAFKPEAWLYDQGRSPVTSGVTVSYTYVNVNTGSTIGSGTATDNGDGSYTGGAINMPLYAGNYINIKFSVPQNSNIISQQIVVFADNSEVSKGAVWKISVFNTSHGPSWDRTQKHNVYMTIYSDAMTPMKNLKESPIITVKNLIGTIVNSSTMTYLENGIYRYTLAQDTISSDGEYYFEITSRWSSRTATGGKSKYTTAIAGFNIEAVGNMGDTIAPDIINWKQSPNFRHLSIM